MTDEGLDNFFRTFDKSKLDAESCIEEMISLLTLNQKNLGSSTNTVLMLKQLNEALKLVKDT